MNEHHDTLEEQEAKARLADQNEHDEGQLALAVAADPKNKIVVIHFGKPIVWIGLDAKTVRVLAENLLAKLKEIE